jgi:RNA:NAD 2'-phosphotransferase (TPT1/KptA family)
MLHANRKSPGDIGREYAGRAQLISGTTSKHQAHLPSQLRRSRDTSSWTISAERDHVANRPRRHSTRQCMHRVIASHPKRRYIAPHPSNQKIRILNEHRLARLDLDPL